MKLKFIRQSNGFYKIFGVTPGFGSVLAQSVSPVLAEIFLAQSAIIRDLKKADRLADIRHRTEEDTKQLDIEIGDLFDGANMSATELEFGKPLTEQEVEVEI